MVFVLGRHGELLEEQEGMEERLGEMRKGSHCFFKSSGYDKLELKHQNLLFFFQAYGMHY